MTERVFTRPRGKVAHLSRDVLPGGLHVRTVCGRVDPEGHLGTGSEKEREKAATLRSCKYCYQLDSRA
jgi:hypothetical protein